MNDTGKSPRSKLWWSLLFFAIAGFSVYFIVSRSRDFTLASFSEFIRRADPLWLLCAPLAMLVYIVSEGEAVRTAVTAFGFRPNHRQAFIYAASDIYFSAITPSATGGQPACAWFMMKDGIPVLISTVALLINLTMYTASILVLGLAALVTQPQVLGSFGGLSKLLIAVGFAAQAALAGFFLLLLYREKLLHRICSGAIHLACKLRLLRHEERRQEALDEHMETYLRGAKMGLAHNKALVRVFFLNLLQRFSVLCVPFFLCLASGGGFVRAARVWAVQCFTVLGATFVPIPGGMGVSDYLMLDGFGSFLSPADLVDFELLTRALSFYMCVVFCGIATLVKFILLKKRDKA